MVICKHLLWAISWMTSIVRVRRSIGGDEIELILSCALGITHRTIVC
jgi:hypothetical protein